MRQNDDTELWVAQTDEGRLYRCVMRFAAGGVEVAITDGDTVVASHVFPSGTEAYAWAEDARDQLLSGE
jgi:hypothetical protein